MGESDKTDEIREQIEKGETDVTSDSDGAVLTLDSDEDDEE